MHKAAFPLMRHFLLWSILTTGLVALLLAFASAGEAEHDLLAKDRRHAHLLAGVIRVQLEEHFRPWLEKEGRDFRSDDAEQLDRIDGIIDYNTHGLGVLRVNFFDAAGTIVYSSDRARIGQGSGGGTVRRALAGEPVTTLVTRETDADDADETAVSAAPYLESYVPTQFTLGTSEVRVVEVYQQGEDNLAAVRASKRRLSLSVIGSMFLLFVGNLVIVKRGSAAIESERELAARYLVEARDSNAKLGALTVDLEEKVERAARELAAADRLAAVGTLAAGMAHEVNTPLASISTCAEGLLRRSGTLAERERKYLETIRDEAFRCKRITRKLLDFARPSRDDADDGEVELRGLVVRTLRLLDFECGAKDIRLRVEGDAIAVRASADELEQVVLNLLKNSLDAVEVGGEIVVRIRAASEGRAELIIDDDGPGVAEADLDRLFDPFYTTKEPGAGTGLGLSVSYGIVKRHGGELSFENRPEGGLRGRVLLPRASLIRRADLDQLS